MCRLLLDFHIRLSQIAIYIEHKKCIKCMLLLLWRCVPLWRYGQFVQPNIYCCTFYTGTSPCKPMSIKSIKSKKQLFKHWHLQEDVHSNEAFTHLERDPWHEHLMSWLHASDTSGMVIHTGTHRESLTRFHENPSGDGTVCMDWSLPFQIPAWRMERTRCCRRAWNALKTPMVKIPFLAGTTQSSTANRLLKTWSACLLTPRFAGINWKP